jgi:hypothetical protein
MAQYPQGEAEGQEGYNKASGTLLRSLFRSLAKRGILTCSPGTKWTCGLFHSESCRAVTVQTCSQPTVKATTPVPNPVGVFILLATMRLIAGTPDQRPSINCDAFSILYETARRFSMAYWVRACYVLTQSPPIDAHLKFQGCSQSSNSSSAA